MGERQVRKMLRRMESGEPVQITSHMTTLKKLARLACVARQFGYEYADARQGGGPQGNGMVLLFVPDAGPQARARAARNRARYPHAGDGGELPPLEPAEVELLKARIGFDLATTYTEKQLLVISVVGFTALAVSLALQLGADATAVVVAGVVWAVLMALLPVGVVYNRRYRAGQADLLRAAGFTPVTERSGRLRYVPPPATADPHAGR
ncbi:hypothetical protein SUDANB176_03821 [Streptomyces sp. enrichment culture]|uniref:hypothetical protein n=1 Tax=Streptomyces sp. enrichment culture TaxID=1795815 RepID=UPI003F571547